MRPASWARSMPFCETFEWIERTRAGDFLRHSKSLFPIVESIHLIGLALFVGTLLLIDMGLLGIAMRRQPIAQVAAALAPWTWSGFVLLLITGPFMFTAQAIKWHDNPIFWIKILLLVVAIPFQLSVRHRVSTEHPRLAPWRSRVIGAVSLLLWIAIGLSGKMMEFV
ncbi:MAG: hypothetical protein JOZ32_04445 [Bryobacterales bacterium]|nr:hypothetical protein [Bryobacterales bacterium]